MTVLSGVCGDDIVIAVPSGSCCGETIMTVTLAALLQW